MSDVLDFLVAVIAGGLIGGLLAAVLALVVIGIAGILRGLWE